MAWKWQLGLHLDSNDTCDTDYVPGALECLNKALNMCEHEIFILRMYILHPNHSLLDDLINLKKAVARNVEAVKTFVCDDIVAWLSLTTYFLNDFLFLIVWFFFFFLMKLSQLSLLHSESFFSHDRGTDVFFLMCLY